MTLTDNDIAGMLAFLEHDGGLVPCSRYGRNSADCAPWAVACHLIYVDANGPEESSIEESLDFYMGLVVNDHDDPLDLVLQHGYALEDTELAYLILEADDLAERG